MATLVKTSIRPALLREQLRRVASLPAARMALCLVLTAVALLVHGYHPYAEDGGIYVASTEHALDPSLFPVNTGFATAHLSCVLFARLMAAVVFVTHAPLPYVFLLTHVISIWFTIFAASRICRACFASVRSQWAAVAMFALTVTLPVAGTSLTMMDPYLTSRSFAMPLVLLALGTMLQHPILSRDVILRIAIPLAIAAAFHPLLAACGLFLIAIYESVQMYRSSWVWAISALAIVLAGAVHRLAPPESAAYQQVVLTRGYWYLSAWQWYEVAGAAAPPLLLYLLARWNPRVLSTPAAPLLKSASFCSMTAVVINVFFVHPNDPSHLVASLQPLRIFQLTYIVMVLAMGALLGLRFKGRNPMTAVLLMTLAGVMFLSQRQIAGSTDPIELPWRAPANGWEQAFLWARSNTPKNALFALDAHYITMPGEDAHLFRAIALRSSLADYSKDGGISAVKSSLSAKWLNDVRLQTGLAEISDSERIARLKETGAAWMILPSNASTRFDCPYVNAAARVCRLPQT